jgi:hypothetical protein
MRRSRNYTYVGMTLVFGIVLLDSAGDGGRRRSKDVMAKDSDFFHSSGPNSVTFKGAINPEGGLGLDLGPIGGFSGEASPLKTFGELIESMREHGMDHTADRLHDGLIKGGATEDWIQNAQMRFTPDGSPSLGAEVDDIDFYLFPKDEVPVWKPVHAYTPGDRVNLHIPPTWWDRVRMFFGFKRKSPATEAYECVGMARSGYDDGTPEIEEPTW